MHHVCIMFVNVADIEVARNCSRHL